MSPLLFKKTVSPLLSSPLAFLLLFFCSDSFVDAFQEVITHRHPVAAGRGASSTQLKFPGAAGRQRNSVERFEDVPRYQRGASSAPLHAASNDEDDQKKSGMMEVRLQQLMDRGQMLQDQISRQGDNGAFSWMTLQLQSLTAHLQSRKTSLLERAQSEASVIHSELTAVASQLDQFELLFQGQYGHCKTPEELDMEFAELEQMSAQLERFLTEVANRDANMDVRQRKNMWQAHRRAKSSISRLEQVRSELVTLERELNSIQAEAATVTTAEEENAALEESKFEVSTSLSPSSRNPARRRVRYEDQESQNEVSLMRGGRTTSTLVDPPPPKDPDSKRDLTSALDDDPEEEDPPSLLEVAGDVLGLWKDLTAWPGVGKKELSTDKKRTFKVKTRAKAISSTPSLGLAGTIFSATTQAKPSPWQDVFTKLSGLGSSSITSKPDVKEISRAKTPVTPEYDEAEFQPTVEQKSYAPVNNSATQINQTAYLKSCPLGEPVPRLEVDTVLTRIPRNWAELLAYKPVVEQGGLSDQDQKWGAECQNQQQHEAGDSRFVSTGYSELRQPAVLQSVGEKPYRVPKKWSQLLLWTARTQTTAPTPQQELLFRLSETTVSSPETPMEATGRKETTVSSPETPMDATRRTKKTTRREEFVDDDNKVSNDLPDRYQAILEWALRQEEAPTVNQILFLLRNQKVAAFSAEAKSRWGLLEDQRAADLLARIFEGEQAKVVPKVDSAPTGSLPDRYQNILEWAQRQKVSPTWNQIYYLLRNDNVAAADKAGKSRWGPLESQRAACLVAALLLDDAGGAAGRTSTATKSSVPEGKVTSPPEENRRAAVVTATLLLDEADNAITENRFGVTDSVATETTTALPDRYQVIYDWAQRQGVSPTWNQILFLLRSLNVAAAAEAGKSRWGPMENQRAALLRAAVFNIPSAPPAQQLEENGAVSTSGSPPEESTDTLLPERYRVIYDWAARQTELPSWNKVLYLYRSQNVAARAAAGMSRWGSFENLHTTLLTAQLSLDEMLDTVAKASPGIHISSEMDQSSPQNDMLTAIAEDTLGASKELANPLSKTDLDLYQGGRPTAPGASPMPDAAKATSTTSTLDGGVAVPDRYQTLIRATAKEENEAESATATSHTTVAMSDRHQAILQWAERKKISLTGNQLLYLLRNENVAKAAEEGKSRWGDLENQRTSLLAALVFADELNSEDVVNFGVSSSGAESMEQQAELTTSAKTTIPERFRTLLNWAEQQQVSLTWNQLLYLMRARNVAAAADAGLSRWGSLENERSAMLMAAMPGFNDLTTDNCTTTDNMATSGAVVDTIPTTEASDQGVGRTIPQRYRAIIEWAKSQEVLPTWNQILFLLRIQRVAEAAAVGKSRWGSLENQRAGLLVGAVLGDTRRNASIPDTTAYGGNVLSTMSKERVSEKSILEFSEGGTSAEGNESLMKWAMREGVPPTINQAMHLRA